MKKHFPMPASLEHGPAVDKSVFMDAVRRKKGAITRENWRDILGLMNRKKRRRKLKRIYKFLMNNKDSIFPGYGYKGILAEMSKESGLCITTITSNIYSKTNTLTGEKENAINNMRERRKKYEKLNKGKKI